MEPTHKTFILPIAGYAGAGKDTLAKAIDHYLKDKPSLTLKFAEVLKHAIDEALGYVGLPQVAFTEDRAQKERLRPVMKEFGKYCRGEDKAVFARLVANVINYQALRYPVIYVTDMRYANELEAVGSVVSMDTAGRARPLYHIRPIYVETVGVGPANEEEGASVPELLETYGGSIDRHTFAHGDFNTIDKVAQGYASSVRAFLQ